MDCSIKSQAVRYLEIFRALLEGGLDQDICSCYTNIIVDENLDRLYDSVEALVADVMETYNWLIKTWRGHGLLEKDYVDLVMAQSMRMQAEELKNEMI